MIEKDMKSMLVASTKTNSTKNFPKHLIKVFMAPIQGVNMVSMSINESLSELKKKVL